MTKKDFELIAKVIRGLVKLDDDQRAYVAHKFAVHVGYANAQFDPKRFEEACR